jgi:hypothetical protein
MSSTYKAGPMKYKTAAKTRMGTRCIAMKRAWTNNPAMAQVVVDEGYVGKYEKQIVKDRDEAIDSDAEDQIVYEGDTETEPTHGAGKKRITLSDKLGVVKKDVQDEQLWKEVEEILELTNPLMAFLRQSDAAQAYSGEVYYKMYELQNFFEIFTAKHVPKEVLDKIIEIHAARWVALHHPQYSVAYLLHPKYWDHHKDGFDDGNQEGSGGDNTGEVEQDFEVMLKRHFPERQDRAKVKILLQHYFAKTGPFSRDSDFWDEEYVKNTAPHRWWESLKRIAPQLAKLAIAALAACVSSSCNERLFSNWKHVMGERRTKMTLARQMMAVAYYANRRLLDKHKKGPSERFYQSSDSEGDVDDTALAFPVPVPF